MALFIRSFYEQTNIFSDLNLPRKCKFFISPATKQIALLRLRKLCISHNPNNSISHRYTASEPTSSKITYIPSLCLLQIKDVTRNIKKALVASSLEEMKTKSAEKFGKTEPPTIHLDSDGTEIDDEDYFQTLESNAELIAVFPGEQWMDVSSKFINSTKRNLCPKSVKVEFINYCFGVCVLCCSPAG